MSVLARPMSTTSRPCPVTPSANARGQRGRAVAHVAPDHDAARALGAHQPGQRRAERPHQRRVELLAHDSADVVGLDDARKVGHGRHPIWAFRGPDASTPVPVSPADESRQHPQVPAPAGARPPARPRPGDPPGRPRGPPRPAGSGRHWWAAAAANSPSNRTTSQPRGAVSRLACAGAQVVGMRLGLGGQRADDGRGVGVDVGERGHRELGAPGPRTPPHTQHVAGRYRAGAVGPGRDAR